MHKSSVIDSMTWKTSLFSNTANVNADGIFCFYFLGLAFRLVKCLTWIAFRNTKKLCPGFTTMAGMLCVLYTYERASSVTASWCYAVLIDAACHHNICQKDSFYYFLNLAVVAVFLAEQTSVNLHTGYH